MDWHSKITRIGHVASLLALVVIAGFGWVSPGYAITGQVILHGGDNSLRVKVETSLTAVINAIDCQNLEPVKPECTPGGWNELSELAAKLKLHNARPVHEAKLLNVPGGYEVRNIKVQVDRDAMQGTVANPYQYMVFSLSRDGLINGVRFSVEEQLVDNLLEKADRMNDFAFRQQILQFVEIYRTAYNRKDLKFIEKVFSDDALIIVGRVVRKDPNSPRQSDQLESSSLNREKIEFIKRSKTEYLNALKKAFANNEYVDVRFDSLSVVSNCKDKYLYGVTLRQEWRSSTYNDTGYVFLMLDFKNEENPLILVRSWQPEKFPDGSTINLYDFQVIRGKTN